MKRLAIAALGALAAGVLGEELQCCGEAQYYPSEYTCYEDDILCPILFGEPTLPCQGACYSPDMYACSEDGLELLDEASGRFALYVQSSNPEFQGMRVHACGYKFGFGDAAETCMYCFLATPRYDCETYANETILNPSGSMDVDLPGSQYWFVDPETQALSFTRGGRGNDYDNVQLAGDLVIVYEHGYFAYEDAPHIWKACPADDTDGLWHIYTPTAGGNDCYEVKLVSRPVVDSTATGAYSYA